MLGLTYHFLGKGNDQKKLVIKMCVVENTI